MQSRFMDVGEIQFNCSKSDCPFEQNMGKCIYEFVKVSLSIQRNAKIVVGLEEFGITSDVIEDFKKMFVQISDDGTLMRVDTRVTDRRSVETVPNIFKIYKG